MFSFFDHLECSACQTKYEPHGLINLCKCGRPLLARYRLDEAAKHLNKHELRGNSVWRYHAMLPVQSLDSIVTLGEGGTPLLEVKRLAAKVGLEKLTIKDESVNPSASFKARGIALAMSRAFELGVRKIAIPSAGNAGGAAAAYAARAGIECFVFMPKDVPSAFIVECEMHGAHVELVDGLISDCGKLVAAGKEANNWFDFSTLKEPYRVEGKKTLGYELAEQMNWKLPEVIVYPTGGGTGLIGMWKAFDEMEALGWIGSARPRMVSVQAEGCAPMARAFHQGDETADPWVGATTIAAGLRVPGGVGDRLILNALRLSGGTAITVSDQELIAGARTIGRLEGIFSSPEGGATFCALLKLVGQGWIEKSESVVLFNTGSGLKYLDAFSD